MAFRKKAARDLSSLCGEVGSEDGADPRKFFARGHHSKKSGRKGRQLSGQVARTLAYVLSGDPGDPLLAQLDVVSVEPAPDESQLMVTVALFPDAELVDPAEVLSRLTRAAGRLRTEVAAAITRRRAPRLMFRMVQRGQQPMEGGADES